MPPYAAAASYAVGWGQTKNATQNNERLHNVKVNVRDCQEESLICTDTQGPQGVVGTCYGDSGGPLYVLDWLGGKQKYILAGVAAFMWVEIGSEMHIAFELMNLMLLIKCQVRSKLERNALVGWSMCNFVSSSFC